MRTNNILKEDQISTQIIGCAIEVHRTLGGPGLLDILVDKLVTIEVKVTTMYNSIFEAQALTYLRLTRLNLALVIYFGEKYVTLCTD